MIRTALLAATACVGLALPGWAQPVTAPSVPPLPTDIIPKPPVTGDQLVWQPSHWDWNGSAYVLNRGHYVALDGHSNQYLPGHWVLTQGGYQWVPAHWL